MSCISKQETATLTMLGTVLSDPVYRELARIWSSWMQTSGLPPETFLDWCERAEKLLQASTPKKETTPGLSGRSLGLETPHPMD